MLSVAVPLILSQGAYTLQQFIDRVFLAWYSPEAVAASTPASILNIAIIGLFFGTAGYVNAFVAQYEGAGQKREIGHILWQGIYIAIGGGALMMLLGPAAPAIFAFVGHGQPVQTYEAIYFRTICWGAIPAIMNVAMAGFFSGRGKPWPVLWIDVAATSVNVVLDYLLIFGHAGFPRLGIEGAALATVLANSVALVAFFVLYAQPRFNRVYSLFAGWRLDAPLFFRLLRYGLPSGIQVFIDVVGFTCFILIVGRLGTISLAATTIAFNVNSLAFMPMLGLGTAVTVLVGRYVGEKRVGLAERAAYSAVHLSLFYMGILGTAYVVIPHLLLSPYVQGGDQAAQFKEITRLASLLLRFVAVYTLFDGLNICFSSAVKGAGDTRFVMITIAIGSILLLAIPTYFAIMVFHLGIYPAWGIATAYISSLGVTFYVRFRRGKWKGMSVIGEVPAEEAPGGGQAPRVL